MGSSGDGARACLVADVGGTHARVGWTPDGQAVRDVMGYRCADHASLADILDAYLERMPTDRAGGKIREAVVAIAGYLDRGRLVNSNLPWDVSVARTLDATGLASLALINDFGAVAHAIPGVQRRALVPLLPGQRDGGLLTPALVLGPGTGLGAALCLDGAGTAVLLSEAGHAALAPHTGVECDVLDRLARRWTHVDNERVLSGPGLVNLYTSLAGMHGASPGCTRPEQIVAAALDQDVMAQMAMDVFCGWLGSVVADLALAFGARDVYLAGGVTTHIAPFLHAGRFRERYAGTFTGGRMPPPVWRIEHGQLGLVGAAGYWRAHHDRRDTTDVEGYA